MKTYKVETIQVNKKYACIIVEANNSREAIDKAKQAEWGAFDEKEKSEHSAWEARNQEGFFRIIASFFSGKE